MKILDLGCGNAKYKGKPGDTVIGIDFYNTKKADVSWDLNKFPYPFKKNEFDMVVTSHVLEHLDDLVKVMEELHRITKPGGRIKIRVPHCSTAGAWTNPTHKRGFGLGTFNYFRVGSTEKYSPAEFKILKSRLMWKGESRYFPKFLRNFIDWLVNLAPYQFERYFVYYFGGFDEVTYELEVVKKR
ncbi:class I SAM-dependent methyltransferase [Candidatus Micrarchaeota archaeon]|nr:class I SAM-dependent methyltransferase [Candidatus Micrarchaeota archaeon]